MNNKLETSSDDEDGLSSYLSKRRKTKNQIISSEENEDKESNDFMNVTSETEEELKRSGQSLLDRTTDISSDRKRTLRRSRRLTHTYQESEGAIKDNIENDVSNSSDEEYQLKSRKRKSSLIKNLDSSDSTLSGVEVDTPQKRRKSQRLKLKGDIKFELPSKSSVLDNIKTTPNRNSELNYYRMNRNRVNNLVKWYEILLFSLLFIIRSFPLSFTL